MIAKIEHDIHYRGGVLKATIRLNDDDSIALSVKYDDELVCQTTISKEGPSLNLKEFVEAFDFNALLMIEVCDDKLKQVGYPL